MYQIGGNGIVLPSSNKLIEKVVENYNYFLNSMKKNKYGFLHNKLYVLVISGSFGLPNLSAL
jgi:hypothetical protein